MPWSASYAAGADHVLATYAGTVSAEELGQSVQAALALARERGCTRFLVDCGSLQGGHSIVDLYELVQLIEQSGMVETFREAIVLPQLQAAADDVRFWETACANRGIKVKVCATLEEGGAWLRAQADPAPTSPEEEEAP